MAVVSHHRITQVNHTKKLKWREVKVGINILVSDQKLHAFFGMVDDDPYKLRVRLLIEVIKLKERLEQLNHGSVVFKAAKNPV